MNMIRLFLLALLIGLTACSQQAFYLPLETQVFQQNRSSINKNVDILWVIDNSNSMETSQQNLASNFNSFINGFLSRGMNFKMAFTSTDAYMSLFANNPALSLFRDGSDATGHSGIPILTNSTPNINSVFVRNAQLGTAGSGDERAFQSIRETLLNPGNQGFLRPNSFLSIIIVSDEDDFSWDGQDPLNGNYQAPGIHTISRYTDFLDSFTNSQPGSRQYNVNVISISDQACWDQLHQNSSGQKIGYRYMQIADATGGVKSNLCSNFAASLGDISGKILELISQFNLSRTPIIETIVVKIAGNIIPENATNGWTYDANKNAIIFHGTAVPAEGQKVEITFDPATPK